MRVALAFLVAGLVGVVGFGFSLATAPAAVAAGATLALELKNHTFNPLTPAIPANTEVMVTLKNLDPTPAEFESDDFDLEKVVPANGTITVKVGPLKPGSYEIHDEYHEAQSKTHLTVQ